MLLITQHGEQYNCSVAEDQNTVLNCYRFNQFLIQGVMHSLPTAWCAFVYLCGVFLVLCVFVLFFPSVVHKINKLLF